MSTAPTVSRKGILDPQLGRVHFSLTRHEPAPELAPFVERHWVVRWDLRGRPPYLSETLPHPCVNLVVEADGWRVHGVATARDGRLLEGRGHAVGTKFRPGGFRPLAGFDIAQLTDRSRPVGDVLHADTASVEAQVMASDDDREQIGLVEAFLQAHAPAPDANVALVGEIVRTMLEAPATGRVADVARRHGLSPRTLQRLFRRYVGVSPKWVLRRYRLHEAAERIALGDTTEPAAMALELGYFDQAHFVKDFKTLVGRSPSDYAAACAAAAAALAQAA